MIRLLFFLLLAIFLAPLILNSSFAENNSLRFELVYPNGDRMPISNSILIVNSEDGEIHLERQGEASEHYFEIDLPESKKYEITVFSHDMLIGTKYISMEKKTTEIIKIPVNSPIGMKFFVFYNDGVTPIENAKLKIYSHMNNLISTTKTDADGKTQRFWLPSTISQGNFYNIEILIDDLTYNFPNIRLNSGSHDFKITTKWPSVIDSTTIQTSSDGNLNYNWNKNFVAELYDGGKLRDSSFFNRGKAHFSQLEVGVYDLVIYEKNTPRKILLNKTISVEKDQNHLIPLEQSVKETSNPKNLKTFNDEIMGFSELKWNKQSAAGSQEIFEELNHFMILETEGNGKPVFTRSESFMPTDFSSKTFQISFKFDEPKSIKEFWLYFSNDNFETSWVTIKIPTSEIIPNQQFSKTFDLFDAHVTGQPDLSKINQMQIRIKDQASEKIQLKILEFNGKTISDSKPSLENCSCVAFRLDDVQDFFLDDVQMKIIDTFLESDIKLTIGVVGNRIGEDKKLISYLQYNKENQYLEFANHGWNHEDFSQLGQIEQENLLLRTNDKILTLFDQEPKVFIPPFNSFNKQTISALNSLGFSHFSTELDSSPPFHYSGSKLSHFPETAFTGDFSKTENIFVGLSHQKTLDMINYSISKYGFAVVTLHPQEFSTADNQSYQNKLNSQQFDELKLLLSKVKEEDIKVTFISEMSLKSSFIPNWIKQNALWWAQEKSDDKNFRNGIQFLINEKFIDTQISPKGAQVEHIPDWIKNNARWWSNDFVSDDEFLDSIQYLVNKSIIVV